MDINISVCLVKEKCHYDRLYLFVYKNIQLSIDSKFGITFNRYGQSQIILKSFGGRKLKGINRITKIG
jgi:hypothetical protein